jgi:hypothetical protein
VGGPRDIDSPIHQCQGAALVLILRIEVQNTAHRTITGARHGGRNGDRPREFLIACDEVQRVQPLVETAGRAFGLAHHVQRSRREVDDGRSGDADLGQNILKSASHVSRRHRGFSGRATVSRIEQVYVPQLRAGAYIRVQRVNAIVLRGYKNSVTKYAADTQAGHPERLGVGRAIHCTGKHFPKTGSLYAACSQRIFLSICAVAGEVIVVGHDPGQVRNSNRRRGTLRTIDSACCMYPVRTGASRRSIQAAGADRAGCGVPTGHSVYAPSHAICRITGDRRIELHRLCEGHNGSTHGTYVHCDRFGATAVARTTPADAKRRHQAGKSAHNPVNAAEHEYCFLHFQNEVFQNDGLFIYTLRKIKASSF